MFRGWLFFIKGDNEKAIASYEAAIETLESVRGDLLSINSDVQFNFRDNVEPLYRQIVAQLLPAGEDNPSQENLRKAIYYVDSLQLAELELERAMLQNSRRYRLIPRLTIE